MLNIKKTITKILQALVVNKSGSWYYMSIGPLTIAWARLSHSGVNANVHSPAYGGYRSDEIAETIPNGIFSATPQWAWATKNTSNALQIKNVLPKSATSFGFYVSDGISETNLTLNYSVLLIQMGGGTA